MPKDSTRKQREKTNAKEEKERKPKTEILNFESTTKEESTKPSNNGIHELYVY